MSTKPTTERWQFDLLLILVIVAVVMGLILAHIVRQSIRERQRRAAAQQNLQELGKAIEEYRMKNPKTSGVEPVLPEHSTSGEK
jgi:Tfp pilus assembly protein PilE